MDKKHSSKESFGFFETTFLVCVLFLISTIGTIIVQVTLDVISRKESIIQNVSVSSGIRFSISSIISAILVYFFLSATIFKKLNTPVLKYLGIISVDTKMTLTWIAIGFLYIFVVSWGAQYFGVSLESSYFKDLYYSTNYTSVVVLSAILVVPFLEEIVFRGFIFKGYMHSLGAFCAIFLTSLGWSMLHFQYSWEQVTYLFFLGIILGSARYKSGSLVPALALHCAMNTTALIPLIHG